MSIKENKDFTIEKTIKAEDVPEPRRYMKSKYDGIYQSCKTLSRGEGLQIDVPYHNVKGIIETGLEKRLPRQKFDCTVRRVDRETIKLFVIRIL